MKFTDSGDKEKVTEIIQLTDNQISMLYGFGLTNNEISKLSVGELRSLFRENLAFDTEKYLGKEKFNKMINGDKSSLVKELCEKNGVSSEQFESLVENGYNPSELLEMNKNELSNFLSSREYQKMLSEPLTSLQDISGDTPTVRVSATNCTLGVLSCTVPQGYTCIEKVPHDGGNHESIHNSAFDTYSTIDSIVANGEKYHQDNIGHMKVLIFRLQRVITYIIQLVGVQRLFMKMVQQ